MLKAQKSFLISLILISVLLISIFAFLLLYEETTYAEPTYTIEVYKYDENALDRKGTNLGHIVDATTTQRNAFNSFDGGDDTMDYRYYIYDSTKDNCIGSEITDENIDLESNIEVLQVESKKQFTITWKNFDDSTIATSHVIYGDTPVFPNGTPTFGPDVEFIYTFKEWSPAIVEATADAEYTASYITTKQKYNITWQNKGGTVLRVDSIEYGEAPVWDGEQPKYGPDAQYTYTFDFWTPALSTVTCDAVYTAEYSTIINRYTIKWKDHNGIILETDLDVPYGNVPSYDSQPPEKEADNYYTYEFIGWYPKVDTVVGNQEFTANYSRTYIDYTITYVYPNEVIQKTLHYDDKIDVEKVPQKTGYKFISWQLNGEDFDLTQNFTQTSSITLHPKFEAIEYQLSYYLDREQQTITVKYDQEDISLKTESMNKFLENNYVFGLYDAKNENKIEIQNDLTIPKWDYTKSLELTVLSIPKDTEYTSEYNVPVLNGYNVKFLFDGEELNKEATFNTTKVGYHSVKILSSADAELYSSTITIKEDFDIEDGETYNNPIYFTAVDAKVLVDDVEIDPTTYRIDKNGTHTVTVLGANDYQVTYTVTYDNLNIIKAVWLIGIAAVSLIIAIILLIVGRRKVVSYGSDRE